MSKNELLITIVITIMALGGGFFINNKIQDSHSKKFFESENMGGLKRGVMGDYYCPGDQDPAYVNYYYTK